MGSLVKNAKNKTRSFYFDEKQSCLRGSKKKNQANRKRMRNFLKKDTTKEINDEESYSYSHHYTCECSLCDYLDNLEYDNGCFDNIESHEHLILNR